MKKTSDIKHIFKREDDSSKITKLIKNISPLFFMSEFLYILFLRYNDHILSTTYKEKVTPDVRENIYNIFILLYFIKPLFAFLTDSVYFNLNNILGLIYRKIYKIYNYFEQFIQYCCSSIYKSKYLFLKIFFKRYIKSGLSRSRYLKKKAHIGKSGYMDNFVYFPLNRKYYVIISEFITTLLLLVIYLFNEKINYYIYLTIISFISSQMLLSSCIFEGVVVERCKRQMYFEKVFYISYVMCVKIFCSLILYYMYILKVSVFLLISKSFLIFLISCVCSEETLLLNNKRKIQRNIIFKSGSDEVYVKNTEDILSQINILKKIFFNENLFKTIFFIILFNSAIDSKLSILQYGVQNFSWPHSLINYIPLVSQSSKLIGISIFQLYTNKLNYKNYSMVVILFNILLKLCSFIFLYNNKNTYVSPFLFLLNIIVQNISIKILSLPILLLCIEKAPLNLESTIINIYIFCFNLSNLISKRYFMWNIILHVSKNVFIILLLSFLTTCASLLYYFHISLDTLNNMNSSSLYLDEKEDVNLKINKIPQKNYLRDELFLNNEENKKQIKKVVRFKEDSIIKIEKNTNDEKKKKNNNLFKISSDYNSDSDQWLIIDSLKSDDTRKKQGKYKSLNISNIVL
ncbi:conserved Plasmodium membrane protein, unknown function [Plasmodium sp. DRC-Itaito]|nr:conserved Plasmodium membrane protein, unknown function [Plasmodium sp. DRC-Itaito]